MRARVPTGEKLFRQAREKFGISFDPDAHPVRRRLLIHFDPSADGYQSQAQQALAVARQINQQDEIAFFLWILGYGRFFSGQFAQAIPILEEAVALFKALGDNFYVAEAMHWLGTCHRFVGQPEKALVYAEEIRAVSEQSGNKFALARIFGNTGIYGVFLDADEARDRLQKAIAIRDEISSQGGIAISLFGLGVDAFLRGEFSQARGFAEDSFKRATDSNSLFPKACALGLFGWLAVIEEHYEEARRLCEESQSVSTNPNVLMFTRLAFAMSAAGLEQHTAAYDHLQHWLQFTRPLHTPRGYLSAFSVMAIIYASQGEAQRAVEVLALIFTHPQSPTGWLEQWGLLRQWQTKLVAVLGEEPYQAVWERGTTLTIESVVQTFLNTSFAW
jgi:tetratricopeptide (TPR) repeat protein